MDAKQVYAKRLREDVTRLQSQYEDLVAQKEDALANVKRLRDLLFQAEGVLERVKRRQQALDAESSDYGSAAPSTRETRRLPASTLK